PPAGKRAQAGRLHHNGEFAQLIRKAGREARSAALQNWYQNILFSLPEYAVFPALCDLLGTNRPDTEFLMPDFHRRRGGVGSGSASTLEFLARGPARSVVSAPDERIRYEEEHEEEFVRACTIRNLACSP
ncbi:MAG: hypothetical protein ACLQIB_13995, partial [Isosphaeraceae bacterium]